MFDHRRDQPERREQDQVATLVNVLGVALSYVDPEQFAPMPEALMDAVRVYEEASHREVVFLAERMARLRNDRTDSFA